MKKAAICFALTLLLVLSYDGIARRLSARREAMRAAEGAGNAENAQAVSPLSPAGTARAHDEAEATLYFRFAGTGALGAQAARLDLGRDETVARLIVDRLIEGPSGARGKLTGLFPQGTRVLSASGEGSTAFVTLSREFLGRPSGAPAGWEDSAEWQEEAALRRRLAAQSIVLSLTEDARYQRVQLYVADSDDDAPRRIESYWFDTSVTDPSLVLAACGRDESFLLTPRRALEMALSAWRARDYETLYALLSREDAPPSLDAFEQRMREADVTLLRCEVSEGAVSMDGQRATLVVDAELRAREGGDAQIVREAVPLSREDGNWALSYATLTSLMIRD